MATSPPSWQARLLTRMLPRMVAAGVADGATPLSDVPALRARTERLARPGAIVSRVWGARVRRHADGELAGEWTEPAALPRTASAPAGVTVTAAAGTDTARAADARTGTRADPADPLGEALASAHVAGGPAAGPGAVRAPGARAGTRADPVEPLGAALTFARLEGWPAAGTHAVRAVDTQAGARAEPVDPPGAALTSARVAGGPTAGPGAVRAADPQAGTRADPADPLGAALTSARVAGGSTAGPGAVRAADPQAGTRAEPGDPPGAVLTSARLEGWPVAGTHAVRAVDTRARARAEPVDPPGAALTSARLEGWPAAGPGAVRAAHTRAGGPTAGTDAAEAPGARAGAAKAAGLRGGDAPPRGAVLYLHGGAFAFGSSATHRAVTTALARLTGLPVLSLDYRLAPEHPFPCALDDAVHAYRTLLARGIAPWSIVLAGDSAGGNLALAALVALRDAGVDLPAGAVLFSPWADLSHATQRNAGALPLSQSAMAMATRMYLGAQVGQPVGDHDLSPLASPAQADLHGLPPLQIQVSDAETMYRDARLLASRLRRAGSATELAIWHAMPHAWPCFAPFLPEARAALRQAATFIRRCTGQHIAAKRE